MTPQERRQIVIGLLDHWQDFFELADSRTGVTADADPDRPMPENWTILSSMSRHKSVLELGRLLKGLREQGPGHYRAVLGYFEAPWRTTDRPVKQKTLGGGRIVWETRRVRERVVPSFLRQYSACTDRMCRENMQPPHGCALPRPVCTAVDVLASGWDRSVPLELPYALLAKLRPLADSDGWTEAA